MIARGELTELELLAKCALLDHHFIHTMAGTYELPIDLTSAEAPLFDDLGDSLPSLAEMTKALDEADNLAEPTIAPFDPLDSYFGIKEPPGFKEPEVTVSTHKRKWPTPHLTSAKKLARKPFWFAKTENLRIKNDMDSQQKQFAILELKSTLQEMGYTTRITILRNSIKLTISYI